MTYKTGKKPYLIDYYSISSPVGFATLQNPYFFENNYGLFIILNNLACLAFY